MCFENWRRILLAISGLPGDQRETSSAIIVCVPSLKPVIAGDDRLAVLARYYVLIGCCCKRADELISADAAIISRGGDLGPPVSADRRRCESRWRRLSVAALLPRHIEFRTVE
jgi:hypothetical protein